MHQIRPTQRTFITSTTFPPPVNELPTSAVGFGWHDLFDIPVRFGSRQPKTGKESVENTENGGANWSNDVCAKPSKSHPCTLGAVEPGLNAESPIKNLGEHGDPDNQQTEAKQFHELAHHLSTSHLPAAITKDRLDPNMTFLLLVVFLLHQSAPNFGLVAASTGKGIIDVKFRKVSVSIYVQEQ